MRMKPKNAGKYGPGIIGEEAFALVKDQVKKKPNKYGPAILGQEEYDRLMGDEVATEEEQLQEAADEKRTEKMTFDEKALDALIEEYSDEKGYVSIAKLKEILEKMPNAFDRLFGWEANRVGGARVGALKHFLELEMKREGGPRQVVLQRIELDLVAAKGK